MTVALPPTPLAPVPTPLPSAIPSAVGRTLQRWRRPAFNLNGATVNDSSGDPANLSLSGVTQTGPQIDTVTPAITSLVNSPASGYLAAGSTVTLTLNLNEAVSIAGGTPTLSLNDGGTATYTGGSGTSVLTFSYTVATGQNTSALAVSAVNLNGATIQDAAGNAASLSLAGLTQTGPQIITTPPTVSSVAASGSGISNGNGDLNAGKTVTLTVNLTGAVSVSGGTPTLSLNDGGTATYSGGSGTTALTFTYTVASGQNTPALAVTAVNLNGASVTDGAGNAANLAGAVTNLAGTLQIDTTTPVAMSLVDSPAGGVVGVGATVTFTFNMSEAVTVSGGTPTLTLNDGGTATYASGSGTSALTFTYTVASGQNTSGIMVSGVNQNGATIADAAGNAANMVPESYAIGPQIDTATPTVSSVVESPSSGTLGVGSVVTLTLNLSEAVTVAGGTPTLTLNDGGTATYSGGSGTSALTFTYTVGSGQTTSALAATAVNLNSATIKDSNGNAANLSLTALTQTGPQIGSTTPTIISLTESPSSGDLNAGHVVTLTLNMNEAVTVAGGTPTLTLNDGGTATYASGSGTSALTFTYTVASGQSTSALAATAVNLNSATIKDSGGNAANLSLTGLTQTGPQIDTTTPTISAIAESPSSGDLDAGKTVTYTLTMSEVVTVNTTGGSPTLSLNDGGTATYVSGSGSSALTFSYTVLAGQNTPDLVVSAVNLNSAIIQDGAGNAANLSISGLSQGSPQIDTTPPTVSSVTATAGDYDAGKTLTLTLNMSEAVNVTGTPTLTLSDGGTASYVSGTGTSTLTFSYTVAANQNTTTLQVTAVSGTIADLAGNALSSTGLPETVSGITIDTTAPTVSSVTATAGDYDAGKALTLTLNMSEAVNVTGTPTLTLSDGGTASYVSGSGTSTLTFSYTVAANQNTTTLQVTGVGGTITDLAGNALSSTGLPETVSGVTIDTTAPTVSSVTATAGDYDAGKALTLTLHMSEAVNVTGTPTLTLSDGGTASYVSGTGTSTLTFSYTVAANQNTTTLQVTGVGGTITDLAGNALSSTGLPETVSGVTIDTTAPTVSSVTATAGDYDAGKTVTLTLNMSEAVNVTGTPTLTLSDGGTASYVGGTGTSTLTFSYTVAANQNTTTLQVTGVSGTITDLAGNALSSTGLPETVSGVTIDTTAPTVSSVTATAGDYDAGKALTLTLNMSEAVNVTGTPTLTLSDGGTASYVSGTGTSTLTFSYTVAANQNTTTLQVTGVSGTIADLAGNALSSTGLPETVSGVTIDTTAPTVSSVTATAGDYDTGQVLTLTLNMSEAVDCHRHADADAQRWRHRQLCQRLRHQHAGVQLHGACWSEHRRAAGDRRLPARSPTWLAMR